MPVANYHVNPTKGTVVVCKKRIGSCTIDTEWHFRKMHEAEKALKELFMALSSSRLSENEITKVFKAPISDVIEESVQLSYDYVLWGMNLGRRVADMTWQDISDEKRAVFGNQFEATLMNKLGAVKLPKKSGLDLYFLGHPFDVKARASEKSKDVSLSAKQNSSLVLVLLYDITTMTYEVHMGYPDEYSSTGPNKSNKFSLSRGNVRKMPKLAEGPFDSKFDLTALDRKLGSFS